MMRRAKKSIPLGFFLTPLKSKIRGQAHFSLLNTGTNYPKLSLNFLFRKSRQQNILDNLCRFYIRQKNHNQLKALRAKRKGINWRKSCQLIHCKSVSREATFLPVNLSERRTGCAGRKLSGCQKHTKEF